MVFRYAADDEFCRRFMAIPGVGPVTALTFRTAVDDPARFKRSRDICTYFGLTSKRWQSSMSIDVQGRISKAGAPDVRHDVRGRKRHADPLQWRQCDEELGEKIAWRFHKIAVVAVARKLAAGKPTTKERRQLGAYA